MTEETMLVVNQEGAKQILELKENGELGGKILRISGISRIKDKFSEFNEKNMLTKQRMKNMDWNELLLAAAFDWISPEAVTDEVKEKLQVKSTSYDNHKSPGKKETNWTQYGMENLDQKNQEKPSLI